MEQRGIIFNFSISLPLASFNKGQLYENLCCKIAYISITYISKALICDLRDKWIMNFATPFMIEPKFKCVWIRRRELSGIYRMPKFASKHFLRGGAWSIEAAFSSNYGRKTSYPLLLLLES